MTNNINRPAGSTVYGDELDIIDRHGDVARIITSRNGSGLGITTSNPAHGSVPRATVRVEGDDLDALKAVVDQMIAVRDGEATYDEPLIKPDYWSDGDTFKCDGMRYILVEGVWYVWSDDGGWRQSVNHKSWFERSHITEYLTDVRRRNAD